MVYTPMMVVNGLTHVNGSDESKVQQAIESSAKVFAATQVPLRLSESGSHIVIEAGAAQQGGPAKEATRVAGTACQQRRGSHYAR